MNSGNIEVSVITITYGHEKYIRQCLDSVFAQETTFPFEVIVAEDASPDTTRQILLEYKEKYGDRLILILHDKNLGPGKNSDSVNPYIRGKYLAILEGDDCWTDSHKLQKQYDFLENNPEYSAVCCDNCLIDTSGNIIKGRNLNLKTDIQKTMKNWLNEPYSVHTCTVFKRNILPYEDPKYKELRTHAPTMGDIINFTMLYDYGPIYVMKDVMAAHRIAGKEDVSSYTISSKKDPLKYTRIFIDIFSALEEYYDHKYDFTRRKCLKIASVKAYKITRYLTYDSRDMKEIEKPFSFKWKMYIAFMTAQELFQTGTRKIKKIMGLNK